MEEKKKLTRPRRVVSREPPNDSKSVEAMVVALSKKIRRKAEHVKREAHDYRARDGLRILHDQRAECLVKLTALDASRAEKVIETLGLTADIPKEVIDGLV